jgi:hypothetical protein
MQLLAIDWGYTDGSRYTAMIKKQTDRCACRAVRFGFNIDPNFVAVCHCLDCKRTSGGEAMTLLGVAEDDYTLLSGQPKAFHDTASSGKGLDRNLCPACGIRLFTSNADSYSLAWAFPLDVPQFETMPG